MPTRAKPRTRNAAETKSRIILAAQALFARKGYAQCSVKEIADAAGVAASLVIKHFGSKADLFGAALVAALQHSPLTGVAKSEFATKLTDTLLGKGAKVLTPALTMAALEDEEARQIAAKVTRDYVLKPSAEWLGAPDADARAAYIMMVSFGFAVFLRLFDQDVPGSIKEPTSRWIAALFEDVINQPRG
jgi:AcrR family transcriptional regulator